MTPVTHLSLDVLADLQEGLLDAETARAHHAHLAACPTCRERVEQLRGVSTTLRDAGGPVSIPAEVATRIDSALRDAAAEPTKDPSATVTPLRPRRRRLWQALSAAAAVIVVAGAAVGIWHEGQQTGASSSAAGSSADTAASSSAPQQDRPNAERGSSGAAESEAGGGSALSRPQQVGPAPTVRKEQVPRFARQLVSGKRAPVTVTPVCARPAGHPLASRIRWHGGPAVLVVRPADHTAAVLDCRTATRTLYSTPY